MSVSLLERRILHKGSEKMQKIIVYIAILGLIVLSCFALCVVSAIADRQEERSRRRKTEAAQRMNKLYRNVSNRFNNELDIPEYNDALRRVLRCFPELKDKSGGIDLNASGMDYAVGLIETEIIQHRVWSNTYKRTQKNKAGQAL